MDSIFDVFVVGGVPSATYNPRIGRGLAVDLRNIVDSRHMLGAVHGPTKCGKSVLVAKTFPEATKIDGVNLSSIDSFWLELASKLDISVDERSSFAYTETDGSRSEGEVGVPATARVAHGNEESTQAVRGREWSAPKRLSDRVAERLLEQRGVVVIDDFHHAPEEVRQGIVRVLKGLLFEGVPVILSSVSHRAFEAVLAEPEMNGRVEVIEVPVWDTNELASIGVDGFEALNVAAPEGLVERLAREALGSPQLMQQFCRDVALAQGIREVQDTTVFIKAPDLDGLFADIARRSTSVSRLNPIKLGPKERGHPRDRMRTLDGQQVDIYGAVLLAIRRCGPRAQIPYRDLKAALTDLLDDGNPNATQVKNTLRHQSDIARELTDGREFADPVIFWDGNDILHIVDPFFSFFVRWGNLELDRA